VRIFRPVMWRWVDRVCVSVRMHRPALAMACLGALAGCVADPGAALIPLPERQATILPSEAPERTADGFANILADPATVPGLPRRPSEVKANEAALAAEGARTEAAAARIDTTGSAAALAAHGRRHAEEARAAIEASGRPASDASDAPFMRGPAPDAAPPGADAAAAPGEPLDPAEAPPRSVGVPPFTGPPVAPQR